MKASIILPAWNEETRIEKCIQALKNQVMDDFECIVVDDGSTDSTYEVALNTIGGDARFKTFRTENRGLSVARNCGLDKASGKYVFYVDADDIPHRDFLSSPIRFLERTDCDIVLFEAELTNCGLDSKEFNKERRYFHRNGSYGVMKGSRMFRCMEGIGDFIAPVYLQAIRKDAIRCRFQEGMLYEDELYTVQNLLLVARAGHLKKALYTRTCRRGSIVQSSKTLLHSASKWKSGTLMKQFVQTIASGLSKDEAAAVEGIAGRCLQFAAGIWKQIPEKDRILPALLKECERTAYIEEMERLSIGL